MSVKVSRLASGLRVVTDAMPHLRTASLGVFIGAGSRHERPREHGLSHLLEHMAFKGTRRRSARDIAEEIEGAGGDLNAETGVEQTAYFARVLGEDSALALDILADILTDSQFDRKELEREKGVILQEIGAVEDAPDDLIFDLFTETAWPEQPIGRPILGTRERVSAFDRRAIAAYLRRNYQAGATIVTGAGAVQHDEIAELAESRFAPLGRGAQASASPARYQGGESVVKKNLEQTHIVVGFEGRATHDPAHDAAHVFAAATGGGMSSRLFQEVREKRGLAYAIYAFHWPYSDTGLMGFYAGTAPSDAGVLMAAAIDCLAEAAHALSEEEIQRAKAQMKVSLLAALESSGARAQQLARQILVYGRPLSRQEMEARIDRLSVEDVRRAGAEMLRSTPTVTAIGRIGKVLDQAGVAGRLAGV
ncbi:MAG TPA: pitrilysin family protein [Roseiarcus sp.]|nr:pitrilysin family protein [Roseiarcus sp.]